MIATSNQLPLFNDDWTPEEEEAMRRIQTQLTASANDMQVGGRHYKDMDPQPWAVMEALLTPEEFRGFLKGNMIKYAMRQGKKDSPDAGKYWHYMKKLSELTGG
jgi:hypothetical protein